ncbi:MAG: hypothetical protein ABIJ48_12340 [Actinomycetota bacterium]
MAPAPPLSSLSGLRPTAGRLRSHALTRLIVLAAFPLTAATLAIGVIADETLVIVGGVTGLAAPVLGSVQLLTRRPHPSALMALWSASVLALAHSPAEVIAEASGLGLAALGTAVVLLHAPRRAAWWLAPRSGRRRVPCC